MGISASTPAEAAAADPAAADPAAQPAEAATAPAEGAAVEPLNSAEEAAWRALARALVVLPRVLDADLLESHGLNLAEYVVLMSLSEQPDHTLRMNELANVVALSASGVTRVIDRLERQRLVERVRAQSDGRGQLAALTDAGLERLMKAYPSHLRSVRRHIMDHLEGLDLEAFAAAMGNVAAGEPGPPLRPRRGVPG
jgi:DNA-binding MarR family transcriptional regulator